MVATPVPLTWCVVCTRSLAVQLQRGPTQPLRSPAGGPPLRLRDILAYIIVMCKITYNIAYYAMSYDIVLYHVIICFVVLSAILSAHAADARDV